MRKENEFYIEMILSRIQFNISTKHADAQTFLVILVQPVKTVFHWAEFSARSRIFFCLKTN